MPAFLEGTYQPRHNDEPLALLGVCQFKELRSAAAGLYAAAFADDQKLAEDLKAGHRYRAACAAALAGCGGGSDGAKLSEEERARWRQQARAWLRADLDAWARILENGPGADRAQARTTLSRWRDAPELAGLREPSALEKWSADERKEFLALWKEVAAVLKRANAASEW